MTASLERSHPLADVDGPFERPPPSKRAKLLCGVGFLMLAALALDLLRAHALLLGGHNVCGIGLRPRDSARVLGPRSSRGALHPLTTTSCKTSLETVALSFGAIGWRLDSPSPSFWVVSP